MLPTRMINILAHGSIKGLSSMVFIITSTMYPCIECGLEVRPRQHAVSCDSCERWQHRKCNTGINNKDYLDAKRGLIELVFTCNPCKNDAPQGTDENNIALLAEMMEVDTADREVDMEIEVSEQIEAAVNAEITSEGTLNCSFDIADRNINEAPEHIERSLIEPSISESIIEDEEEVTYTILPNGSKRGGKLLVSSDGYSYGVKGVNQTGTRWRCSVRSKSDMCLATVHESGDSFTRNSHSHNHPADPKLLVRKKMYSKVVGQPFQSNGQLMTINVIVQNDGARKQFPVVFVLMSRRRKTDYIEVLEMLKEKIGEVEVEAFVLDFESAAWQAIRSVFPGIGIKGCMFHWTQAVYKHVQQLGLAPAYRQRQGTHLFIRQLLTLPCLPSIHIQQTFDTLAARVNTPQMQRLVDYIENQWMNNTVFDVSSWSIFGHNVRTNNDVEGWHRRLNSRAGAGLGFYKLVPVLRKEADIVEMKVKSNDLDQAASKKSKKLNEKLQDVWDKYSRGDVTTSQLLKKCAELFAPKKDE